MSTRFILYCTLLFVLILPVTVLSTGAAPTALLETMYFSDPGIRIEAATCLAAGLELATEAIVIVAGSERRTEAIYTSPDGSIFSDEPDEGRGLMDPRWVEWPNIVDRWFRVSVSEQGDLLALQVSGSETPEAIELRGDLPTETPLQASVPADASGDLILLMTQTIGTNASVVVAPLALDDAGHAVVGPITETGIACDLQSSFSTVVLSDGRIRLYAAVDGKIMSWVREGGGVAFTAEAGVRIKPEDFAGLSVRSLSDPCCVHLADGRYRLYMTAEILVGDGTVSSAIVSATTPTPVW